MEQIKLVLIGEAKSGKTSWIQRLKNEKFTTVYSPTIGVDVSSFVVETNHGLFRVNIWDCAGAETLGGGRTGYYTGSDGCIIFHDLSIFYHSQNIRELKRDYQQINPDSPVVSVGNKWDELSEQTEDRLNLHKRVLDDVISAKESFQVFSPIECILQKITGIEGLEVVKVK